MRSIIDKLMQIQNASDQELLQLIATEDKEVEQYLSACATAVRERHYGNQVYIRGLIEFTNYCKNDCRYCGIRRSNAQAYRYRLTKEEILSCCHMGYAAGFRTFVLQGGEDPWYTEERMVDIIAAIHKQYPDCAITLSVGEKSRKEYQAYFDAGANRFLLRHETANERYYGILHPEDMHWKARMQCLQDLKEIGYQVGCGMMIGAPKQTPELLLEDLRYMQKLQPHMVGMGPFLPHHDTPFREEHTGSARQTLRLLSIVRLMLPNVLLPATTALKTKRKDGYIQGIAFGANVIMPNLSPKEVRKKYMIYDNKVTSGEDAGEQIATLKHTLQEHGYFVPCDRGDWKGD